MGYRKSTDVASILSQLRMTAYECSDQRTDSWVAWGLKQDLYQLKWELDKLINRCPTFAPENDWLREQEQNRIVEILKK